MVSSKMPNATAKPSSVRQRSGGQRHLHVLLVSADRGDEGSGAHNASCPSSPRWCSGFAALCDLVPLPVRSGAGVLGVKAGALRRVCSTPRCVRAKGGSPR
jgi:hypothetical protein